MDSGSELHGMHVVLQPVSARHVKELKRILHTPEVRARWGDEDGSPNWPFDDPYAARYTIIVDDQVCGLVQFAEESEPSYRHASIDIFLDPAVQGRGLGRDAIRTVAEFLVHERGHHRMVIDPAADNEAAIRCYAAVGFRIVGTMRQYERDLVGDGWHDGVLMELLAQDLQTPAG